MFPGPTLGEHVQLRAACGQRRNESTGDLIQETLLPLTRYGVEDNFINTIESKCLERPLEEWQCDEDNTFICVSGHTTTQGYEGRVDPYPKQVHENTRDTHTVGARRTLVPPKNNHTRGRRATTETASRHCTDEKGPLARSETATAPMTTHGGFDST